MVFQVCIEEDLKADWKMPLHNWCQTIKLGNEGKSSEKFDNWYKVILSYSPTQSSLWVSALLPLSSPLFLFLHQSSFCCCHLWAMWPLYHHYTTCAQCTKNKKDWIFLSYQKTFYSLFEISFYFIILDFCIMYQTLPSVKLWVGMIVSLFARVGEPNCS